MTHKISSDGAASITLNCKWLLIDRNTPRGVKMMLISEKYGIAQISIYSPNDKYFTHWHPLPTFKKELK